MPVNLPTAKDVREARARATKTVNENLEQVRAPLLAWIGANDWAASAVRDAVWRARTRADKLQGQLPRDVDELRGKLSREELRKAADSYGSAAREKYQNLVQRGEGAVDRVRARPQVKRVLEGLEGVSDQVEERVEEAVEDFRERGTQVLGQLSRTTRSVGERAARVSQRVGSRAASAAGEAGDEVAGTVHEAADEAAQTARRTSRKAANRTAPKKPAARRPAPKRAARGTSTS